MAPTLRDRLATAIVGEGVHDWGIVFDRKPGFFRERIGLALREKDGQPVLTLTYKYSSVISYNAFTFAIPVFDLAAFVRELQAGYDRLRCLAGTQRGAGGETGALPLAQRLMIKVIHGIRASALLLDHRNPSTGETEYLFYGYVTRKSEIKVFIQSDLDIVNSNGHVISGEGFQAALNVLTE